MPQRQSSTSWTRRLFRLVLTLAVFASATAARADDGYHLWLRYAPLGAGWQQRQSPSATVIVDEGQSPTLRAAGDELSRGLRGMFARDVPRGQLRSGALVIGTPRSSPLIARLGLQLSGLGEEGYLIRSMRVAGQPATVIAANGDAGVLYGAFAYLRLVQTNQSTGPLDVRDAPKVALRILNHWDNLDRTVERGYAGQSLWDWHKLPSWKDPRYTDYARANASIGINATVLNNVNSNADILTPPYLQKVAALADAFRPYAMRVFLSARFSAPIEIGGLATADPADPRVRAWWKAKVNEIYRTIPDFGGFLVKANSEGQPGPQQYGRSHADGANMLADALAPHGGTLMWRAFVYSTVSSEDRAKEAYNEFKPLDGRFRGNVIVQVKNGPIDFQPREPFHPLFGAMPATRLAMEVQITKEYLGFATHLAYLSTMWSEALRSRTFRPQRGSTAADSIVAVAGVANTGTDRNWSGSHFDQANWYAFGRLAWDPEASPAAVAQEWARQTWGNDPQVVRPIVEMMMRSRQAVVDYMTPLGLAHLMGTGHHYGPAPWVSELSTPSWNPAYYHRADRQGIGFDRTATGSNAVAQYAPELARIFGHRGATPEDYLLWFHHLPWGHRMASGATLWEELVRRYDRGVVEVEQMNATWASLRPLIDPERHAQTAAFLRIQRDEAKWWRDASIAYFRERSGLPLPDGASSPAHPLDWYKAQEFRHVPGNP